MVDMDVESAEVDENERHATWLELFFDLIAVAGVSQLAHLLHGEPGARDFAYYAVLFCAFWMTWTCFTLYGNVAGDRTRIRILLAGMFGMAVMAAAVQGVHDGRHMQAFAVVYILMRILGSRVWQARGQVLLDWPTAQFTLGVIPWTLSVWVDAPARYWLWAAGIALDLWATFGMNGERFLERVQQRDAEKQRRQRARRDMGGRDRGSHSRPARLSAAYSDPAHLGERLGLFVLIVLGEGVAQLVAASAATEWDWALYGLAIGSFLLLVMLWSLSLRYGYGGVPGLAPRAFQTRTAMALHLLTAGALAAVAAGLGAAVEHRHGQLPPSVRLLLCVGFAVYVLIGAGVSMASHSTSWRSGLRSALPALALPLLIGAFGNGLPSVGVVWLLIPSVAWPQGWHTWRARASTTHA